MRKNVPVTRLVGGLNFHLEHYVHGICHVHYSRIAMIIDAVGEEFGIPHTEFRSYAKVLAAHYRFPCSIGYMDIRGTKPEPDSPEIFCLMVPVNLLHQGISPKYHRDIFLFVGIKINDSLINLMVGGTLREEDRLYQEHPQQDAAWFAFCFMLSLVINTSAQWRRHIRRERWCENNPLYGTSGNRA